MPRYVTFGAKKDHPRTLKSTAQLILKYLRISIIAREQALSGGKAVVDVGHVQIYHDLLEYITGTTGTNAADLARWTDLVNAIPADPPQPQQPQYRKCFHCIDCDLHCSYLAPFANHLREYHGWPQNHVDSWAETLPKDPTAHVYVGDTSIIPRFKPWREVHPNSCATDDIDGSVTDRNANGDKFCARIVTRSDGNREPCGKLVSRSCFAGNHCDDCVRKSMESPDPTATASSEQVCTGCGEVMQDLAHFKDHDCAKPDVPMIVCIRCDKPTDVSSDAGISVSDTVCEDCRSKEEGDQSPAPDVPEAPNGLCQERVTRGGPGTERCGQPRYKQEPVCIYCYKKQLRSAQRCVFIDYANGEKSKPESVCGAPTDALSEFCPAHEKLIYPNRGKTAPDAPSVPNVPEAHGLCPRMIGTPDDPLACGKPIASGFQYCAACVENIVEEDDAASNIDYGLCSRMVNFADHTGSGLIVCGKPVKDGYVYCEECLAEVDPALQAPEQARAETHRCAARAKSIGGGQLRCDASALFGSGYCEDHGGPAKPVAPKTKVIPRRCNASVSESSNERCQKPCSTGKFSCDEHRVDGPSPGTPPKPVVSETKTVGLDR